MPLELTSAVIAAFVGAFAGVLVQALNRQHVDRHRFTDLKRERYSEFLRGLDDQRRQMRYQHRVTQDLGRDPGPTDQIPEVVRPEPLKLLSQEIQLLAPSKSGVGPAARKALEALSELRGYRYDPTKPPPFLNERPSYDGFDAAVEELVRAIDGFTDLAKRDLGSE